METTLNKKKLNTEVPKYEDLKELLTSFPISFPLYNDVDSGPVQRYHATGDRDTVYGKLV